MESTIYQILLVFIFAVSLKCDVAPAIVWDPTNPFFNCPATDGPEILLKNGDFLTISCPHRGMNLALAKSLPQESNMYESVFLISDTKEALKNYKTCNAADARQILQCDSPTSLKYITLAMRQYSASSSSLLFKPGKTYYLVGTSNRVKSSINNRQGGCCSPPATKGMFSLKMKIRVCTSAEIAEGKCEQCKTAACYNKGCGTFNSWKETKRIKDLTSLNNTWNKVLIPKRTLGPTCTTMFERTCQDQDNNCVGPTVRYENTTCPVIQPIIDCYQWSLHRDVIIRNGSECLSTKSRRCIVGVFAKIVFQETELYSVDCPQGTTLMPATTAPSAKFVCQDWERQYVLKSNSSSCFEVLERNCTIKNVRKPFGYFKLASILPITCPDIPTTIPPPRVTTKKPATQPTTSGNKYTQWGPWGPCFNYLQSRQRGCYNPIVVQGGMRVCLGIVEMFRACGIYIGSASTGAQRSSHIGSTTYLFVGGAFVLGLLIGVGAVLLHRRRSKKNSHAVEEEENNFEFNNSAFSLESPKGKEFPHPVPMDRLSIDDMAERLSINHNFGRGMGERTPSAGSLVELKGFTPLNGPAPELQA